LQAAQRDAIGQLKESDPGRNFTVTMTFPAGFEIPQGEHIELSVKSSNPQFPVLKVPVTQTPRPTPAVPVTGQVIKPASPTAAK
jgi:hypothetical protein